MMKKRKLHMDILRILAVFFVIYNHTEEKGYYLFYITENPVTYPFYMALSILCSIAVPLFFMISGALLLKREESPGEIFRKRVSRIALVILLFSFVQYVYYVAFEGWSFSLSDFAKRIISQPIITPYWYLYAYLAYILMLPFLRSIVRVLSPKWYIYLFALYFLVSGIGPILQMMLGIDNINLSVPLLETTVFYPLAGYYFEYLFPDSYLQGKTAAKGAAASALCVAVLCLLSWHRRAVNGGELEAWNSLVVTGITAVPVCSAYITAKWACSVVTFGPRLQRVLPFLSSLVFGIYLLEERVRWLLVDIDIRLAPMIGWMPACFMWILCVMILGGIITCFMKKIPGLKKML